mmetsp:Transcript_16668/g.42560  ORF Transcript_16668/g.42560 Transcript_16668/m.42560 type:complete len:225 (+) Transcript_16668:250-924(+)
MLVALPGHEFALGEELLHHLRGGVRGGRVVQLANHQRRQSCKRRAIRRHRPRKVGRGSDGKDVHRAKKSERVFQPQLRPEARDVLGVEAVSHVDSAHERHRLHRALVKREGSRVGSVENCVCENLIGARLLNREAAAVTLEVALLVQRLQARHQHGGCRVKAFVHDGTASSLKRSLKEREYVDELVVVFCEQRVDLLRRVGHGRAQLGCDVFFLGACDEHEQYD